jgi:hypothetical protein
VGEILLARKEPDEGATLVCDVVADGAPQYGMDGFQRVQDGTLGDCTG